MARNRLKALAVAAVLAAAAPGWTGRPGLAAELETPIAAELFAAPRAYAGKRIAIYGLVVEARRGGREFLLQDVSQKPLKVLRRDGLPTFAGDQLMVEGTVIVKRGKPLLEASRIEGTKVLGGGGCC